ncbi:DUF6286 domain-containing protein [Streptomyces microflavus]|uniref:DUF6286 domain-containing protein n=1 Tax=Streptomyces microflavus TaxID=1919 RepID=UPI0036782A6F
MSARAVARIAQQAATETGDAVGEARGRATVQGHRAEVSVRITLPWPGNLSRQARTVQQHVATRTSELTGLTVRVPRLGITRLQHDETSTATFSTRPTTPQGAAPRRWWSPRPIPVVVLALLGTIAAGLLTADVIAVHLFDRAPATWRTEIVNRLAVTHPSTGWATVVAGAAVVVGLWLLVLAATPGLRGRLVVAGFTSGRTIALDRSTVASLVRNRVLDVAGIDTVRVSVGRRHVRVRAALAFGDPSLAREQARIAANEAIDACELNRPLRCRLRLRTTASWEPHPAPVPNGPASETDGVGTEARKESR